MALGLVGSTKVGWHSHLGEGVESFFFLLGEQITEPLLALNP